MKQALFKDPIPSLYKASPSTLCDITNALLYKLADIPYGNPVRDEIRDHISNISTATMIIHRLGCPMDLETPWMQERLQHTDLTVQDVQHFEEANASLTWVRSNRHIALD
jgi:hypothetical protein